MFFGPFPSDSNAKNVSAPINWGAVPLTRLSDAISRQLGVDIVRGLYAPGEKIPGEIALASQWNVSRTAVREGLRVLDSKGFLETRTKTGTTVRPRAHWHLLDSEVLAWLRHAEPDHKFIAALIEFRLIVEPQATALAAKRRSNEDLSRLSNCLDIMRDVARTKEAVKRAELQFHKAIIDAAGNHTLIPLAASIEAAIAWSSSYGHARNICRQDTISEYQRIFDAVQDQDDAGARWRMEVLIRTSAEFRRNERETLT